MLTLCGLRNDAILRRKVELVTRFGTQGSVLQIPFAPTNFYGSLKNSATRSATLLGRIQADSGGHRR